MTLTTRLQADSDFQAAADLTFAVAGELYGSGSSEQQAVQGGWDGVGITINPIFCQKISPASGGKDSSVTNLQFFR